MSMSGADAIVAQLRQMDQALAGDITERMIEAGAAEVKKAWKAVAQEHDYHDTGAMIRSIDSSAGNKREPNAIYREIYPQGKDDKGMKNAAKAFILHYGTSRIKASYWVDEAEQRAEDPCNEAMTRVWDEYLQTQG